jgi:hypothetical protein
MAVPYTFASATSAIPLSQLDSNFATAVTIGNVAAQLGNTVSSVGNLTLTNVTITSGTTNGITQGNSTFNNVTITSVASTFPNNYLSNSSVTIGNTAAALGSTVTSFGNVTLTNATISSLASTFPNNYLSNSTATLGNATITLGGTTTAVGNLTLNLPTITNYVETLYSVTGSSSLSLSNGTVQKVTTSGSTTITLPASVSGKSFTVIVYYAAADAITWAGGTTLKWAGGTTPTATSATGKYDIFNFYQDGTNTYGSIYGQNY